ncbi:hypothetical protein [Cellulomonas sp. NPDC058312]|uniref:phage holin n=1 Tax=Cellulomonas sp. NPDC058312 TaxID=3346441 RepID=UPI0036F04FE2
MTFSTPTPSLLNLRSWADLRALVHVAAPVLAAVLVAKGWADSNLAGLLVTLVAAVASPAIATINTANGFRRWFYPVIAAVAAVLIALGYLSEFDYSTWLPVIVLFIGPAVAAANTPTTIDGQVGSVTDTEFPPVSAEDESRLVREFGINYPVDPELAQKLLRHTDES